MKYVSSPRHQPADRLNVVLGIRPPRHTREMPFGELDALYSHILSFVEERETLLLILRLYLLLTRYPSHVFFSRIEDIEVFLLLDGGYIDTIFVDLSSVITISNVPPYIHILHASLQDFLLDATRSKEFYIDLSSIHTTCMCLCFHHIKNCALSYLP